MKVFDYPNNPPVLLGPVHLLADGGFRTGNVHCAQHRLIYQDAG